ncbi:MAG: HAD-IB family phosphatase [Planctomycetota bacterium]
MVAGPPFASVWFDCDSTLTAIEGIDELVRWAPAAVRDEVPQLTTRAMAGELPLAEVYGRRLALLSPRREHVERIGALYVERLVPDARAVVAALQALGKRVGIVSGGLLPPVQQVALALGVDATDVHAVRIDFAADGSYAGFDQRSPFARNLGKVEFLRALPPADRPTAFVGDGITDAETRGVADRFVGFGGVVARSAVAGRSDAFVATASLAGVLPHVLTAAELRTLAAEPRFAALAAAAVG